MRLDLSFILHLGNISFHDDLSRVLEDIDVKFLPSEVMFGPRTTSEEDSSDSIIKNTEGVPVSHKVPQVMHSKRYLARQNTLTWVLGRECHRRHDNKVGTTSSKGKGRENIEREVATRQRRSNTDDISSAWPGRSRH